MTAHSTLIRDADLAGFYSLRRRPGTDGFYLLLNGRRIGNVYAPIEGTVIETWGVSLDAGLFPEDQEPPAPFVRLYHEFPTLSAALAFLNAEEPLPATYSPWSYEAGFHSGASA